MEALFGLPMNDLLFKAQAVHRRHFDPNSIQLSTLMNIKSGGCPEDCAYCPQSVRHETGLQAEPLATVDDVTAAAVAAKRAGATRFCMGAAWRSPKQKDLARVTEMIHAVKALGMETCATLGMLDPGQARDLKQAGLDYYNHNVDTGPAYYRQIISTRRFEDRLETLENVRDAGLNVCCGGIIGMGEAVSDRAQMLMTLANLPRHPESVPINMLVKVEGTPLAESTPRDSADGFDLVRTIAVARITLPRSYVRLSAGRSNLSDGMQALCYFAGANSIFYGERLLTTDNPETIRDRALFSALGLNAEQ
jgi:biotin synthase